MPLEGKVAFITGAARGQGRAHAARVNAGSPVADRDVTLDSEQRNHEQR